MPFLSGCLLQKGRPDICHFFSINVLLGSIFLHMKARKLWQKLHKFCIYGDVSYITHMSYVENFRFLHICHVETSEISPYVEKFSNSHNCHTWRAEFSPQDNFFSTNIIRDKYQVCPLGQIFVHHILSRRIFSRHIVSGHADSAD